MDSSSQTTASAAASTGGGNGIKFQPSNGTSPMESSATTTVAAAGIPTDDPKQNLTQVINSIQKTLGILHQLYLNVSSFNVASQLPLLQRMNNLVLELDRITRLAKNCNIQMRVTSNGSQFLGHDMYPNESHVPLDHLDDGKNPDKFTQDIVNGCVAKNQITKGKTGSFKALRRHLLEELDQAFPDEGEAYREIRKSSAAESKGLEQVPRSLPNGDVKLEAEI